MTRIGPLREVDDTEIAPRVGSSETLLNGDTNGPASFVMTSGALLPLGDLAKVLPQAAGENVPDWFAADQKAYVGEISAIRMTDCYYLPKFGILIDRLGRVSRSSFSEARFLLGDVAGLPNVRVSASEAFLDIPANIRKIDEAAVFMPWGATSNYGHFVLDALPSLVLLSRLSSDRQWNVVCPAMSIWQHDLYDLVSRKLGNLVLTSVSDDIVFLRSANFFTTMDHFLHKGGRIWSELRTALLSSFQSPQKKKRRIIIVREDAKRTLLNQSEIVAALAQLGFQAVSPEQFSIEQQRELFSQAEIVVGVSGAGLANVIFCQPGARVVEIQPSLGRGIWVRNVCLHLDLGWAPFFVESRGPDVVPIVGGTARPEIGISFRVPVMPFVAHIRQVVENIALGSEK